MIDTEISDLHSEKLRNGGMIRSALQIHMDFRGHVPTLFVIARLTARNTILKRRFTASRFGNHMIHGKVSCVSTAVCTLESITNKDISFAEIDLCFIDRSNEFNQFDDGGDFHDKTLSPSDNLIGVADDFDFVFHHQTNGASPVYNVQK
jgi:hypothetical protein